MALQSEVAKHLNLSDRQIRNLSSLPGAPKPQGRGGWDIDAWRNFYIAYLRSRSRDVPDSDEPEGEETNTEKSREQQLKNQERQERILLNKVKRRVLAKRYAPVELISVAISRSAIELRTRVESLLPRLKKIWPNMPIEAEKLLNTEMVAALNDLADLRIDLSDYDVSDIERDLDRLEALESDTTDDGSGMG